MPNHLNVNRFTGKAFYVKMSHEERGKSPLVLLREKVGLTQEALALLLGVTDHTVRNWEKGRSEPKLTIRQIKALCRALDCSLDDLPDDFAPINQTVDRSGDAIDGNFPEGGGQFN